MKYHPPKPCFTATEENIIDDKAEESDIDANDYDYNEDDCDDEDNV